MKNCTLFLVLFGTLSSTGYIARGQDFTLRNRSGIELNLGVWNGSTASSVVGSAGVRAEAKVTAFVGGFLYANWLQENLALTASVGLLAAEASSTVSVQGVSQRVSSVVPVLLGLRFFIPDPANKERVRPFVSAAVGPYIGFETKNAVLAQETHSETAIGVRLGAGVDLFLSNHFKLGANVGYDLMSRFARPIGAREQYNGAEFSFGVGYVFGG